MRFLSRENKFKKLMFEEILPGNKYDISFAYSSEQYSDDEYYSFDIRVKNSTVLTVDFCCDGDWITEVSISVWDDDYKNLFYQVRKKLESVLSAKYPIFADSTKWTVEFIPDTDNGTMEGTLVYSHTNFKYWLDLEDLYRYDDPRWK